MLSATYRYTNKRNLLTYLHEKNYLMLTQKKIDISLLRLS